MATTKKYDLAVKTGTYIKDGQEKGRYENVGSVMHGDNGPFLILKRTFNPAGVPNPQDKDSVIVSCFEPQQSGSSAHQQQSSPPQGQQMGVSNNGRKDDVHDYFSEDVPY